MNGIDVAVRTRFNHYKNRAKKRHKAWKLSFELFKKLVLSNCVYCGQKPYMLVKTVNHSCLVNGVDRKDSKIGYIPSNCTTACRFCNCAKGDVGLKEFKKWIWRLRNA